MSSCCSNASIETSAPLVNVVLNNALFHFNITLHYINKYLKCPKSTGTTRTLYEIRGKVQLTYQSDAASNHNNNNNNNTNNNNNNNVQMAPLCFPGLKGNHWLGMSQSLTPMQSHTSLTQYPPQGRQLI